jgi:O-antigen ligase
MSTINAPAEERDESQQGRLHFWKVAVAMANDHPFLGVGHRGFEASYNRYDSSDGLFGRDRAVHSSWFGILSEVGYPGMALFVLIIFSSLMACRKVRLAARRGEIPDTFGRYAIGFEASLASFVVGGTFVSFHYSEMLWHFFALTMALERVAMVAAETHRAGGLSTVTSGTKASERAAEPEPEFAWG